jgi:hypothetical protein
MRVACGLETWPHCQTLSLRGLRKVIRSPLPTCLRPLGASVLSNAHVRELIFGGLATLGKSESVLVPSHRDLLIFYASRKLLRDAQIVRFVTI